MCTSAHTETLTFHWRRKTQKMEYTIENTTIFNFTLNTTAVPFARDESLARVEILLQILIFVLAALGNGTVLLSLMLRKKKLTRMHILMIHLSVADLFVAFGSVLPQIAWDVTFVFKGGDFLCRLVKYMQVYFVITSKNALFNDVVNDKNRSVALLNCCT